MTCEFRDAVNRLAPLVLSSLLQAAKSAGPNFVASRHVKVTRNQLLAQHADPNQQALFAHIPETEAVPKSNHGPRLRFS